MGKKEIRNVGFEKDVMVPVDVKTNLASIDVDMLSDLYKKLDIEKGNNIYYRDLSNKLKDVNRQVVEANEKIQKENAELKEENDRLKTKIVRLQVIANSMYGLPKTLCCGRQHPDATCYPCIDCFVVGARKMNDFSVNTEAFIKALEAGKPTYDQLLEENEKLKRENHSFRRGQESLEAEIDELDKECDALVEEKEKLQDEVDNLQSLQCITRDENTDLKMEVVKLREMNERVCKKNKELEEEVQSWKDESEKAYEYVDTDRKEIEALQAELEILDKLNADKNNEIKSLETRLDNVIKSRKEINDEYTAYVNNNEDQSYYSMWHNLADEYCKLEDKYNKVYIQYEKYKKYCEDIVDKIVATKRDDISDDMLSEPSGTGCCLNEDE